MIVSWLRTKIYVLKTVWRFQNNPALSTHTCKCGHWSDLHFRVYYDDGGMHYEKGGCAGSNTGKLCLCKAYRASVSVHRRLRQLVLTLKS